MSMQGRVVWTACVLAIAMAYPGQVTSAKKTLGVLEGRQILLEREGATIDLCVKDNGIVRLFMASSKGDTFEILVGDRVRLSMSRKNGARFLLEPGKDGRYLIRCGERAHQAIMGRVGVQTGTPYYGISALDANGREVVHLTDSMNKTASFILRDDKGKVGVMAHTYTRGGFLQLMDSRSDSYLMCGVDGNWERMIALRKGSQTLGQISASDKEFEIRLKDPSGTKQASCRLDRDSAPIFSMDK